MRNNGKGLGLGIFLLTAGVVWLLYIAGIVNGLTLNALVTLWPLALVALGIGVIFRRNPIVRTVTWLLFVAAIIGYGYFEKPSGLPFLTFDSDRISAAATDYSSEKEQGVEKGELTVNFGAAQFFIDSDTTKLLDADIKNELVRHEKTKKDDGKTASFKFYTKNYNIAHFNTDKLRSVFHLGKDVPWDLKLNTGATEGHLNLSGLRVEDLDIATGASKFNVDLGSWNTKLNLDAGASQIEISLPKDTGMKVRLEGALNDTNLDDQDWEKKDGCYYSPDYDTMQYKIDASVKMGVGQFTVTRR
jgi:hypothetical protein